MRDRITTIIEHWFIQEPALFQILCTHELAVNTQMACPIRSGRRRIEYNPDYADVLIFEANVELALPVIEDPETPDTLPPWRRDEDDLDEDSEGDEAGEEDEEDDEA